MKHLSRVNLKIGIYYLFVGMAFGTFGILDVHFLMPWWVKLSGYGLLLIAAALPYFLGPERLGNAADRRQSEMALLKAKEAAEAANEAKSRFLANMSHEIRTPMNSILGFTEILMDEPLTKGQRESVEILKLSAETLMSLIDEILDLSKIESDTIQLDEAILDLRKLVIESVELVRAQVGNKRVALSFHLPAVIPKVIGDPLRLRQVLLNLLGNALKFTQEGEIVTRVRILEDPDDKVVSLEFSVSDTGVGIPEEKLENIFEAFTQADPNISKRFGGTGLGLAICRRLVDLMGGKIVVQSTPGKGTTFHFQIRLMKAVLGEEGERTAQFKNAASNPDARHTVPDPECRRLRILMAEDDAASQTMTSLLLEKRMGHRVAVAENGAEAVKLAKNNPYDIILMDVNMPVMDGLEATRKIRESGSEIPILALTASAMKGDRERFLDAGMDGYLSKPINVNVLKDVFEGYCGSGVLGHAEAAQRVREKIQGKNGIGFYGTDEQRAKRLNLPFKEYQEILAEFISLRKVDMENMKRAIEDGDTGEVYQLSHKIKGSAKMLALERIAGLASEIEHAALKEDLAIARGKFKPLDAALKSLLKAQRE